MLIASVVGNKWKEIYGEALEEDYRFLSYGDSSLLFVNE
jgi:S-adenosylmethionine:tRNA ribosyltransferase-isomerase